MIIQPSLREIILPESFDKGGYIFRVNRFARFLCALALFTIVLSIITWYFYDNIIKKIITKSKIYGINNKNQDTVV